jgi:hypothetical protein
MQTEGIQTDGHEKANSRFFFAITRTRLKTGNYVSNAEKKKFARQRVNNQRSKLIGKQWKDVPVEKKKIL